MSTTSAYLRVPFTVADPTSIDFLKLNMKYDAGFVAYINGVEVARANAPLGQVYNSEATLERNDGDAVQTAEFNLSEYLGAIVPGTNVLAIHGLNSDTGDSDFLIVPELIGTMLVVDAEDKRYFPVPTPDDVNGAGLTDVGPVVAGVTHTPHQPTDAQNIVVTATVTPTQDAVANVTLRYVVMYGTEVVLPMFDDGAHGDGLAGDNVYGATIPASASTPGQMVRWYVLATDTGSDTGRAPLYLNTGTPNAALRDEQYYGTVIQDPTVVSNMPIYQWFVPPTQAANHSTTPVTPGGAANGGTVFGSIYYNGEFYDNVETNIHGQSSQGFLKKSLDVDFPDDHRFVWAPGMEPTDDINWFSNHRDKAKMRNSLAFYEHELMGDAYHLTTPIRIQQNGVFLGVYESSEDASSEWLERIGLNGNGSLYKMYNIFDSTASSERKTDSTPANLSDLTGVAHGHEPFGAPRTNYFYDNINFAGMANYLAGFVIDGNTDCCHKNYYFYRDTNVTNEWWALPWDVDLSNGRNWGGCGGLSYDDYTIYSNQGLGIGSNNNLMGKLFQMAEFREMFLRRIRTLMDEVLQPVGTPYANRKIEAKVDELEDLIGAEGPLDHTKWGQVSSANACQPFETWPQAVDKIRNQYLEPRRIYLNTPRTYNLGGANVAIPASQPANANLAFGTIAFAPATGNQDQESVQITNSNTYAVDISGWTVEGDIQHTFQAGTVIAAGRSLYITPDAIAFRAGPTGLDGLFVQGNYDGHLSARGGTITIKDKTGRVAATTNFAGAVRRAALPARQRGDVQPGPAATWAARTFPRNFNTSSWSTRARRRSTFRAFTLPKGSHSISPAAPSRRCRPGSMSSSSRTRPRSPRGTTRPGC